MALADNLRIESVSRLAPSAPHYIDYQNSIAEAIKLMRKHRVGCLLVCREHKLIGVFTERDLLTRVLAKNLSIEQKMERVMTHNPVCITMKDPIRVAIKKMVEGGYRHLPVINEYHIPIGILSVKRVIHYLIEYFPDLIYNLPSDPNRIFMQLNGA